MSDERYERGRRRIEEVDGRAQARLVEGWGDLGRYILEFAYGDVYSRPDLTLREREIASVALLTALGGREPQLRVHLDAALEAGLTPPELEGIVIHTVPYTGFPTAINAMRTLREVLERRERHARPAPSGGDR